MVEGWLDYTLRTVALGAALLGGMSGALGAFVFLRRQSMAGDAIAHATLPGVVLAFLLTGQREPHLLLLGAALAGSAGVLLWIAITRWSRVKQDSALGIVLSTFLGGGVLLLNLVQNRPGAYQAGLNHFLFGQAATLLSRDVAILAAGALGVGLLLLLFWKEFQLLSFDRPFGASLGWPMQRLDIGFTLLVVAVIVLGLQSVGVVLMSALLVAPAAAARQWVDGLGAMVLLAAALGAVAGVSGTLLSALWAGLATGPLIVLCASTLVLVSLLWAPRRGLVWRQLDRLAAQARLR